MHSYFFQFECKLKVFSEAERHCNKLSFEILRLTDGGSFIYMTFIYFYNVLNALKLINLIKDIH